MKLGCHIGLNSKDLFVGAVNEAKGYGANCFMIYTGAPQNTIRKKISEFKIEEANNELEVIVHAPYIVNLANPDDSKREFSISFLASEVKRAKCFNSNIIVLHPGSHMGDGIDKGIERVAEGLKKILEKTQDTNVKIALETMAGKGTEIGSKFEELAKIIEIVNDDRVGVCFDTCHVNDAGYDLNDYSNVINEFEKVVGKDKILVFHINDSKNPVNSHKDRHENIGFGTIGFDALVDVLYDEEFENIPHILETPYIDGKAPYREEIQMLREKKFNKDVFKETKEK